jgi:hypothetical protein
LKDFLAAADASDSARLFDKEDVKLSQLPSLNEAQFRELGLKLGTANRVFNLAREFSTG